ncbi:MAG: hypothetical protein ACRD1P_01085, partial [Thermoanaerobaculia bacterium]
DQQRSGGSGPEFPQRSSSMKRLLWIPFLFLQLTGCSGTGESEAIPYKTIKLDSSWTPLYWIADDMVVFKDDNSFFSSDVRARTEAARVPSGPISVNCVDFDKEEIHFATVRKDGGSTSYTYGSYLNLRSMSIEQLPEDQSISRGQYNCPRFLDYRAKERRHKHEKLQVLFGGETWQTRSEHHYEFDNLIRDSQGYLAILDTTNPANDETRLLYLKRGEEVRFQPAANVFRRDKFGVAYDSFKEKYLIYQGTNDFERNKGPWPLRSYLLNLGNLSFQEGWIPEGPWVVDYGFLDRLKGFSCGIPCYTNMRVFLVGDKILISVWGRLVNSKIRGLYELQGERWVKLKTYHDEDSPAIVTGRDGCRLIIHQSNGTLLFDLCTASSR